MDHLSAVPLLVAIIGCLLCQVTHGNDETRCPFQCKCVEATQPRKVTSLGCAQGGTPSCPDIKEPTNLVCRDGTMFSRNDVLRNQAQAEESCICPDGIMPKCQNTKDHLKCPDGSDFDLNIGNPGPYVSLCEKQDGWTF